MHPILLTDFYAVMLGAALVNNLVLIQFLGVSSVFNSSKQFNTAVLLALFSAPVMIGTILLHYLLSSFILQPFALDFLELTGLVAIAGLITGLMLKFVRRFFPQRKRQQFLLLFMVGASSVAIGAALQAARKDLEPQLLLAFGCAGALGFSLIVLVFAAIHERLALLDTPAPFRGLAIELIAAGLAAMALLGIAGVV